MNKCAVIILKNGSKISDSLSVDEENGLFEAWSEYLIGQRASKFLQLNGDSICAVFDPTEVAAIYIKKASEYISDLD